VSWDSAGSAGAGAAVQFAASGVIASPPAGDSEFRILLTPGTGEPIVLELESLEDIAVLGETRLRLRYTPPTDDRG